MPIVDSLQNGLPGKHLRELPVDLPVHRYVRAVSADHGARETWEDYDLTFRSGVLYSGPDFHK